MYYERKIQHRGYSLKRNEAFPHRSKYYKNKQFLLNVFVLTEGMSPAVFSCGPICWNLWRFNWLHNKIK